MHMKLPIQIIFRNMESSAAIETAVRERADKLDQFYEHIMSCRVVIELHHRHHHQGNLYHVRVDLKVPEAEIVASREPAEHHAHEDVDVAIRDAFNAVQRRLEEYGRRRPGAGKKPENG